MQDEWQLEHKFARFGARLALQESNLIQGYASLFGEPDQSGDVVEPGAYAASLAALKSRGAKVKMLWQHDPAQPLGVWEEVREDARGLHVKGRILTETRRGAEAAALIAAGAIDGLLIGYRTRRASRAPDGTRRLQEIELWEVSLVTFPMLPSARVASKAEPGADAGIAEALRALAADLRGAAQETAGRIPAGHSKGRIKT